MYTERLTLQSRSQRGLTLIELVIFIIIVSVALAGVLTVLNITTKSSADPLIRKQMLSMAEGLLEEVQFQPFTWCDPDDANVTTATSTAGCAAPATVEAFGPEAGEVRTDAIPLDNVNDYNGCAPGNASCDLASPIKDLSRTFTSPAGYSAAITVTPEALNGVGDATSASASLRIAVTICHATSCPSLLGDSITLEGYRLRHSPNFVP